MLIVLIQCSNSNKYYSSFQLISVFSKESIFRCHDFKQESSHRSKSWSEKKLPKNFNIPNYNAIIHILLNLSTYFCLFWESISGYYEFKPKGGPRTNSWSEWGINLPKHSPKLQIFNAMILQCNNSHTIIKMFNIFLFFWESISEYRDFKEKKWLKKPTAGVNKAKVYPKTAQTCKYSYFQWNDSNIKYFKIFSFLFNWETISR